MRKWANLGCDNFQLMQKKFQQIQNLRSQRLLMCVDNYVDNGGKNGGKTAAGQECVNKSPVIHEEIQTFPLFFAEKRYKLCNFAPKKKMVDNLTSCFIISKKQFTLTVEN